MLFEDPEQTFSTRIHRSEVSVHKVVVLNPKGGSGKTTLATNLAAYYATQGLATALLDHDSQGSSTRWMKVRGTNPTPIHGIAMYEIPNGVTRAFAQRIPNEIERVVVDTPAAFPKQELARFVQDAHKIIIPVLPCDIDIYAATRTIADLLLHAKINRRRLGIVANRVKRNTIAFRSLMKFLASLDIPVVGVLRDTQNYIKASQAGLGLHEFSKPALEQDVEQWRELISWAEPDKNSSHLPCPFSKVPVAASR